MPTRLCSARSAFFCPKKPSPQLSTRATQKATASVTNILTISFPQAISISSMELLPNPDYPFFRCIQYCGGSAERRLWPVRRHQAGISAGAPGSWAMRSRTWPGCMDLRRRRSFKTNSPQAMSPASQVSFGSAGRAAAGVAMGI